MERRTETQHTYKRRFSPVVPTMDRRSAPCGVFRRAVILITSCCLLVATPHNVPDVHALTSATITIDGTMSDWDGVFMDAGNAVMDTIIPDDPDNPGQGDRDIDLAAATWDDTNLYLYWRRTSAGSRAVTMFAYIDLDGDGLMQSTDVVVILTFGNSGYQSNANSSNVVYYEPSDPAGDPMRGDGYTMAGSARPDRLRVPGAAYSGAKDSSGLRFEGAVDWASLGVSADSPISIQFAAGNGTQAPGHIEDNAGPGGGLSFARASVTIDPPNLTAGGAAGSTVSYSYALTNTGNIAQTYSLSALSSASWDTSVLIGDSPATSITLAPGASATVQIQVAIPPGTADGAIDTTTLRATSTADPGVFATATARTTAGAITVTPDGSASIHPGGTVVYRHTVSNNTGNATDLSLTSLSSLEWNTRIFAADGVTPLASISLGAGESIEIVVEVDAPAGAAVGSQDVTTVRAQLASDPSVQAASRNTTTLRKELTIVPDRASVGGPGTAVSYPHTVTNNSGESRTINLGALSSQGWSVSIFAADGVTPISSVTLEPYGGSTDIYVRVNIPSGASTSLVDATTVTASYGSLTAQVTDTTTVSLLATYDGPGFGTVSTQFKAGDTVYARATGLGTYSQVRFRWIDSTGTVVYTSPSVPVDSLATALSSYGLPTGAALGEWTLVLVNASDNAEITRSYFDVMPDAEITSLSASDAPGLGQTVSVSSSVSNSGATSISDSTMTYVIWWDADGDGVFGAGDLYIDSTGNSQIYDGVSNVSTHVTSGIDVAAGGTWTEPSPWSMSNAGFPNQGTYRVSATWSTMTGETIDTRLSEFYSIPALGWPLFALTLAGAMVFMWRSREKTMFSTQRIRP